METYQSILWTIALVSTGVFGIRFILSFMGMGFDGGDSGMGGEADSGHDAGHDLQLISVYTVISFLMVGSWTALAMIQPTEGMENTMRILAGLGAGCLSGFVTMYVIAWTLSKLRGLESDGTLRNFDAKGLRGEVYLTVPPVGEGEGQVRLEVKGALKIFRAVNEDDSPIESFKPVLVTGMTKDHVLRVRHTG